MRIVLDNYVVYLDGSQYKNIAAENGEIFKDITMSRLLANELVKKAYHLDAEKSYIWATSFHDKGFIDVTPKEALDLAKFVDLEHIFSNIKYEVLVKGQIKRTISQAIEKDKKKS